MGERTRQGWHQLCVSHVGGGELRRISVVSRGRRVEGRAMDDTRGGEWSIVGENKAWRADVETGANAAR